MSQKPSEPLRNILADAIVDDSLRRVVLSRKRRTSSERADKVVVRPVTMGESTLYQFAKRIGSQEVHENLDGVATVRSVTDLFNDVFEDCHVFTDEADFSIRLRRDGSLKIKRSKPTLPGDDRSHDRTRQYLIPEGIPCRFLDEIGVMTGSGKVRSSKYRKFRQINRFLELVDDVVGQLPSAGPLRIIDFGCGKSYLTFALEHLLRGIRGREVSIVGLDRNADVVSLCNTVSERLGLQNIRFEQCDIAEYQAEGPVHLAVSLHACDTATDDAIARAIQWQADVILSVPCCQHEIAPRLASPTVEPILRHGILRDRFAALATDALRVELLELAGYRTQVVEFIDMEHTAKNLLIRAVKRQDPSSAGQRREAYERFRASLGLDTFRLQTLLQDRVPLSPSVE